MQWDEAQEYKLIFFFLQEKTLWCLFTVVDSGDMLGLISASIAWSCGVSEDNDIHHELFEHLSCARLCVLKSSHTF